MRLRSLLCSASALPLFFLSVSAAIGGEKALTVKNPGFESGLDEWVVAKGDSHMSTAVAEAAHSGKMGLRVTDGDSVKGSSVATASFDVEAGGVYEGRFWARCISGDGISVYLQFFGADGKKLTDVDDASGATKSRNAVRIAVPKNTTDWKAFTVRGTAPEGAVKMYLWIHSANERTSVTDVDDFEVVKID